MAELKKIKFHKLIQGYETDLNIMGTYNIFNKDYKFSEITAKDCEHLIVLKCPHIKKVADNTSKA